ncbi:MAG: hypothetical protein A2126_02750 [Candidatus Woykebacteria bacterium GWB1_45_5]|uniref:Small-conductance mechanosensitive ion channel n=2 Tax=Candidatus Woykeibacteriota TaxID=1817899 RepID=A0A1G1VZV8_9BACT|nr:MAG: hypothetical protein A2113_01390 [Candidatus Woykebacteria bacterium GWA1_44_8]OGY24739.1 MAG: hypothetical protein A2126_02750 [Candidatus Woykebacteria bacterium GWB1_45_5]
MIKDTGNSVLSALNESLTATANLLPSLLAAIVIFIFGVMVALFLRRLLLKVLETVNFEKALAPTGIPDALKKTETSLTVSGLLGELLRWFVILIFLIPAVDQLGLGAANKVLSSLLLYIPNVVVAVIIVAIGAIFAKIARDFVAATAASLGAQLGQAVGEVARYAIIIFTVLAALNQLGVASDLIRILFTGFVAMIALAGGLAFGLGGRETAEKLLRKFFEKITS